MADKLILDALFPPPPTQLIADLEAVGADGAAVYVWRPGGVGTWTSVHVAALRAAGKLAFPIIVPEPGGGDINGMLGAARAFGFEGGPITIDLEPPNLPPAAWEENFDSASASLGFEGFDYGTSADLGLYQPDNASWLADWLRTGQLQPLPAIPPGRTGLQFVNDITINGHQYDASMVASSVFGGSSTVHTNDEIYALVASLWLFVLRGYDDPPVGSPAGTPPAHDSLLLAISNAVNQLNARPPVALPADFAAQVATALAAEPTFLTAIAKAVAHELGTALGNA